MKINLNEAYQTYHDNPTVETYEWFGKALLSHVQAFVYSDSRHVGGRKNIDMVEDAIGDTIIKVLERLPAYDPKVSKFGTWVDTIAVNTIKDALREIKARSEVSIREADKACNDFETQMANKLTVKSLIASLKPEDQQLVKLKLEGWEDDEVAEKMGLSYDTVTQRWKRIKKQLAQFTKLYYVGNTRVMDPEEMGGGMLAFTVGDERYVAQKGEWKIVHEEKKV